MPDSQALFTTTGLWFPLEAMEYLGKPKKVAIILFKSDVLLFSGTHYTITYPGRGLLRFRDMSLFFRLGEFPWVTDDHYGFRTIRVLEAGTRFYSDPQILRDLKRRLRKV